MPIYYYYRQLQIFLPSGIPKGQSSASAGQRRAAADELISSRTDYERTTNTQRELLFKNPKLFGLGR